MDRRQATGSRSSIRHRLITVVAGLLACLPASGAEPLSAAVLRTLSIEDLMALEVTSVSRTGESLGSAAAAITVISGEDIRRMGATTLPEALRHVPGLHVARRNANSWAVSARGFSSVNSEKLLVLSDTRSLYTPLFSGVFWDVQDFLLQDIERIEVIRGPGAALWGSNAVNGVINITTKSALDTQGLYLEGGTGTEERGFAAARYGGRTQGGIHYRVFGKYSDRDATFNLTPDTSDDWRIGRVGFRADWQAAAQDSLTLQGAFYRGNIGQLAPAVTVIGRPGPTGNLEVGVSGGNVLGRWRRELGEGSDVQLRAYYDRTHRNDPSYDDDLDTVDIDLQHRFGLGQAHEIIWGLNYRYTSNRNVGKGLFAVEPPSSDDQVVSAFIQDQVALTPALRLTLGTKLEHNDFSGAELQPSVRVAWEPAAGHVLWGSASRAARIPTRYERDIAIDVTDPAGDPVIRLLGSDDFDAEDMLSFELGHRWAALDSLFIDLTAFHNRYDGLASLEFGAPFIAGDGRTVIPVGNENLTDGTSQGIEALITLAPSRTWQVTASHAWIDLDLDATGQDLNRGRFLEGSTPRHQFSLRTSIDLPRGFGFDAQLRSLSRIRQIPDIVDGTGLPGYTELDVRISWEGLGKLEVSLVGQNLLHDRHVEFSSPAARGQIERSVYGKVAWGF